MARGDRSSAGDRRTDDGRATGADPSGVRGADQRSRPRRRRRSGRSDPAHRSDDASLLRPRHYRRRYRRASAHHGRDVRGGGRGRQAVREGGRRGRPGGDRVVDGRVGQSRSGPRDPSHVRGRRGVASMTVATGSTPMTTKPPHEPTRVRSADAGRGSPGEPTTRPFVRPRDAHTT